MKCFWCKRLHEDGKLLYVQIRAADYVYEGMSYCEEHLDLTRRYGVNRVLQEGMMAP